MCRALANPAGDTKMHSTQYLPIGPQTLIRAQRNSQCSFQKAKADGSVSAASSWAPSMVVSGSHHHQFTNENCQNDESGFGAGTELPPPKRHKSTGESILVNQCHPICYTSIHTKEGRGVNVAHLRASLMSDKQNPRGGRLLKLQAIFAKGCCGAVLLASPPSPRGT